MTRTVSEASLVSTSSPIQLENSQIIVRDEDENSNVLSIDEYCPNREAVNLENAAVNIDNSNDVIIGPVTQLNVNGNVTIYSGNEAVTATSLEQEQSRINIANGGSKKNDLTIYCFRLLYFNKDLIRNATILLAICLTCLIVTLILTQQMKHEIDDFDYNYTEHNYGDQLGQYKVCYRSEWGAKPPKLNTKPLQHPVGIVIISHTSTFTCNTTEKCRSLLREVQMKHFAAPFRSVDIGYNFMIGGDGNIYVGRGWDIQNFHRKISIGINFIGNFNYDDFTADMVQAAQELIKEGVRLKKISDDYILVGENQTNSRMYLSPGANVYGVIKNWPHFYSRTLF